MQQYRRILLSETNQQRNVYCMYIYIQTKIAIFREERDMMIESTR